MSAREQAEYYREYLLEELDTWLSMPEVPSTGLILIAQDAGIEPSVLRDYADPHEPPTPRTLARDLREQIEHAALQQIWAYQSLWGAAALTKPNDDILEFYEGKSGINVAFNGVEQHQNLSLDEAWKIAKDFGGYAPNQRRPRVGDIKSLRDFVHELFTAPGNTRRQVTLDGHRLKFRVTANGDRAFWVDDTMYDVRGRATEDEICLVIDRRMFPWQQK